MLKDKLGEQEAIIAALLPFKEQHISTQQKLLETEFTTRQSQQEAEVRILCEEVPTIYIHLHFLLNVIFFTLACYLFNSHCRRNCR